MSVATVKLIHALDVKIEVEDIPEKFAPSGYLYVLTEGDFLEHAKTMREIEKDRNDWIRRYDNVLTGLKYWRGRALEK